MKQSLGRFLFSLFFSLIHHNIKNNLSKILSHSVIWAIQRNHFLVLLVLVWFVFHQLVYPIKFDFSVSVLVHCLATLQSVDPINSKTGVILQKCFPIASFKALKCSMCICNIIYKGFPLFNISLSKWQDGFISNSTPGVVLYIFS